MLWQNNIPKRRLGIEIEFIFPTWGEIEHVVSQGFPIWVSPNKIPEFGSDRKWNPNKEWKLITDSSVKNLDGSVGFEFNSPYLQGQEGLQQIRNGHEITSRFVISTSQVSFCAQKLT